MFIEYMHIYKYITLKSNFIGCYLAMLQMRKEVSAPELAY